MVFLSHSSKDKDFVRELHRRLKRDGVECFFDEESIKWGDNYIVTLDEGIRDSEQVVIVLSPNSISSRWVTDEWTAAKSRGQKLLPLKLQPCELPSFLGTLQAIDVSSDVLFEMHYPTICHGLGGTIKDKAIVEDRTKLPSTHPLPIKYRMPYRSLGDNFVGRLGEFWRLHDDLKKDGVGILAGTGGLGKTQLAIEYAHRFGSSYPGGVYWVDADQGIGTLITQVSEAAQVQIDTKSKQEEQTQQLWRELNALGKPYLLILDNFPENEKLQPYLPTTGRVHTVVTTRRQDLDSATVRLPVLSPSEGAELLNSGMRDFGADARKLADKLGGLPLALELARSFLNNRKSLSIDELLKEMQAIGDIEALNLLALEYRDQLPSGHEIDVVKTFEMSWRLASDRAKSLLRVMGELAPAPVPRGLLRLILDLPEQSALKDELNTSVAELFRLSFVGLDQAGNPFAHRLILEFARSRNVADTESPLPRCFEIINQQMLRTFDNPAWIRCTSWN